MFHGGFVGIRTRFKNIIFGTALCSRIIQIYGLQHKYRFRIC
ncbi:hypothetical protein LEP1GSC016_3082 [Leptospira borgpetersenii serovar Hardjo-bovis str. Sponselee]|uniref:Uncharacterized protein n=1 Tax=Leptospira borgpetersenii serovar Hardjo-bovis str. Sponselee TaxID=1303729 RepID=M6BQE5_LEPBO|nr:hypothetical protein LEP1GSC016_3082 [Leptospira borgpetersenii serovar Hardjo-bovis str. Sponselee]